MNRLEALVALNMVSDIGSTRLKKLLEFFHQPEEILKALPDKLRAISGIGPKIAAQIHALKNTDLEREFTLAEKLGLKIMTFEDKDYPLNLKYTPDPPIVLYLKGKLQEEDNLSIAIVGSRRASFYGLSCAEKFAAELSSHGFTIVSGMARGIDTSAHHGALKQGGRTIAVMGSGFQHIYPQQNLELVEEISQNGAVISEFSLGEKPLRQNFPRRNRVISGLSLGVLVVEAAKNSGALITADFALEQGRDVFALPGKVDAQNSFGTNGLIKQGARLVSSVEDILEEFEIFPKTKQKEMDSKATDLELDLSSEELVLYNLLSDQPVVLDEIVERTHMNITTLANLLLKLQIKRLIKQLPGKQFVRSLHAEEKLSYR